MLFPTSERRSHHNCPLVNFLTTFRIAHKNEAAGAAAATVLAGE
jgi:hypothetical protein